MNVLSPKKKFEEWVEVEMLKKNSTIMSQEIYDSVVGYLSGKSQKTNKAVIRRVRRKAYALMNYPTLKLMNVLCAPSAEQDFQLCRMLICHYYATCKHAGKSFFVTFAAYLGKPVNNILEILLEHKHERLRLVNFRSFCA